MQVTEKTAENITSEAQEKAKILARVSLLSSEIDANEEENRVLQDEITELYALLDKMKSTEPS